MLRRNGPAHSGRASADEAHAETLLKGNRPAGRSPSVQQLMVLVVAAVLVFSLYSSASQAASHADRANVVRTPPPVRQWRGSLSKIAHESWADASTTVCGGSLYIIGPASKEPFGTLETTVIDTVRSNDIQSCCEQCASTLACHAFLFQMEMCQLIEVASAAAAAAAAAAAEFPTESTTVLAPVDEAPRKSEVDALPVATEENASASSLLADTKLLRQDASEDDVVEAPPSPQSSLVEIDTLALVEENVAKLPSPETDALPVLPRVQLDEDAEPSGEAQDSASSSSSSSLEDILAPKQPQDTAPPLETEEESIENALAPGNAFADKAQLLPVSSEDADEDALANVLLREDADDAQQEVDAPRLVVGKKSPPPSPTKDLLDSLDLSGLDLDDLALNGDDEGKASSSSSSSSSSSAAVATAPKSAKDILSLVDSVAEEMTQDILTEEANARAVRAEDDALRRSEEAEEEAGVLPPPDLDEGAGGQEGENGKESAGADLLAPVTAEEEEEEDAENASGDDEGTKSVGEGNSKPKQADAPPAKSLVDRIMAGEASLPAEEAPNSVEDLLASSNAEAEDEPAMFDLRPSGDRAEDEPKTAALSKKLVSSDAETSTLAPLVKATKPGESLMPQAECTKLATQAMSNILAAGMYNLVIVDPFYKQKQKFFGRFRAVSEVHTFISDWQAQYAKPIKGRPWQIDTFTVGRSAEDRPIRAFEFGNPRRGRHVFVIAGLRGCDWIGPLAAVHAAVALVGRKRSTQALLDAVRFHVVPLVNVDGYHYSRRKSPTSARHWCDNRRISAGGHGTNLERNWGVDEVNWGFGKKGKDSRKDKLGFQGIAPFSEPEVKAVRDYIQHYVTGSGRAAVVHVRCCVGQVSSAMGERKPDVDVSEGASTIAAAMRAAGEGTDYAVVKRPDTFSAENTGQMVDWAFSLGADHSYVIELRATNVATHMDRYQITPEPFNALSKELEVALVSVAQLLLASEVQGLTPPDFKPKLASSSAAGAAASSSKASAKSGSSSTLGKKSASTSSKTHKRL